MSILYVDLVCGAGGDMILASLIDAGFSVDYLNEQMDKLKLPGLSLGTESVVLNGIRCSRLKTKWDEPGTYRHLNEILQIIERGNYSDQVYRNCEAVLNRLADAEAKVHGVPRENVHFHEVGAVDTIVDILGICLGLEFLGISQLYFSTLIDGRGTIQGSHGTLPVPVPATSELIKGCCLKIVDIETELLTPTASAILTTLGKQKIPGPTGVIKEIGIGCGEKEFKNRTNILRSFILDEENETTADQDRVIVLETDMDHISGELMGNTARVLMDKGALDVSWIPLYMKKGRPGYRLSVICSEHKSDELLDLIFLNTRTLGVRVLSVNRTVARREETVTNFNGMEIQAKECSYKEKNYIKPEYEALVALAQKEKIPLIELLEQIVNKK